jgi:predicted NBD/HSP70 family sugar kinase
LPDAPFLLGELSPVQVLARVVAGPVTVDNDVNWAARAERDMSEGLPPDNFVYLFLGEGLGSAVVADGAVRRGHTGIAGEIAHVVTTGPDGRAIPFTDVFRALDLRLPGSSAIDVEGLLRTVAKRDARGRHVLKALGRAVAGVLAAAVGLLDPARVVVGGPWGTDAAILDAIHDEFGRHPRHTSVEPARCLEAPALAGARNQALTDLRVAIATSGAGPLTSLSGRRTAGAAGTPAN